LTSNFVPFPPDGLVVALQYWSGDEGAAMRLARLLADVEVQNREDVTLAFCRRFDCPPSSLAADTFEHCAKKFRVMAIQSRREGVGHPHGCNELWSGTMDQLSCAWAAGNMTASSVFTIEADGLPMSPDWIDRLQRDHTRTMEAGKRITGPLMGWPVRHINGSLIAHLSMWGDRLSLHRTPSNHAWDIFHAVALMAEARPTSLIKNVYGSRDWSDSALASMSQETAWLANTKDTSAIEWAERTLVER